jgi:hypothetical protein
MNGFAGKYANAPLPTPQGSVSPLDHNRKSDVERNNYPGGEAADANQHPQHEQSPGSFAGLPRATALL